MRRLFLLDISQRSKEVHIYYLSHLPCFNARDNKYAFLLNAVKYPAGSSGVKACVGLTTAVSDSSSCGADDRQTGNYGIRKRVSQSVSGQLQLSELWIRMIKNTFLWFVSGNDKPPSFLVSNIEKGSNWYERVPSLESHFLGLAQARHVPSA